MRRVLDDPPVWSVQRNQEEADCSGRERVVDTMAVGSAVTAVVLLLICGTGGGGLGQVLLVRRCGYADPSGRHLYIHSPVPEAGLAG